MQFLIKVRKPTDKGSSGKAQDSYVLPLSLFPISHKEIPSELLKDPEIGKAIEELEIFDFTDVELRVYDKFWDSVSVERTLLDDSYQKGLEEGRKEAELNKVLQIARNLLNLGLSISEIIEITDLTQEQIEHLKES